MKLITFLIFFLLINCSLRPNILFILTDDMGYGEIELYPADSKYGRLPTPNINKLGLEGLIFTDAYAGEPVCAPSRCSLMTGRHTGHTIVRGNYYTNNSDLPLRDEDYTIAEMLKSVNYTTGLFGKWGLGANHTTGAPLKKGWDYFYGELDQALAHNMYPTYIWDNYQHVYLPENENASRERCMKKGNNCSWVHDLFTDRAMWWIEERKNDKNPWFAFISWTDPHAGGYNGVAETGNPVPSNEDFSNTTWPDVEKDHASAISMYEDKDVGRFVELLKRTGMYEDTLIIFASDNGPHGEGGHSYKFFNSSGPLKGFKRSLYEGGMRTPYIFHWANTIEPGQVSELPTAFWDIMPTLAELSGADVTKIKSDGISIVPTLLKKGKQEEHDYLYWEFCTNNKWGHAVRIGKYKGVSLSKDDELELYDLEKDIGETNNIAKEHPDIIELMKKYSEEAHEDNKYFPIDNCVSS